MIEPKIEKVVVIGLDCAPPQLVFDKFLPHLPNIGKLVENGIFGPLNSTIPPITCPAWMCMMSGKNPGTLGVYGFRNRKDRSYDGLTIANSTAIKEPLVWDVLGRAGKKNIVLGVPQTYPPRPIDGLMVTCFLTPSIQSEYTYPPELKDEIAEAVGEYILDVDEFRTDDKEGLLMRIHKMTNTRFALARHLMKTKPWDFFMLVEMGTDRIHHAFWKYHDPAHPKHEPGNLYEKAILKYYIKLDGLIGGLLEEAGENTAVMIVSDHGAKRMLGGVCFNEWLIKEGYLTLAKTPDKPTKIGACEIDWSKTAAWGDGGYYGRLFINVEGREPNGVIPAENYEKFRDELIYKIENMTDEKGRILGNKVFRPEEVYGECKGIPPDLIVYFGDLDWRSVGSVGHGKIFTYENDTGPDDANHDQFGIFILAGPGVKARGPAGGLDILDCAPTIFNLLGIDTPSDMAGKPIV